MSKCGIMPLLKDPNKFCNQDISVYIYIHIYYILELKTWSAEEDNDKITWWNFWGKKILYLGIKLNANLGIKFLYSRYTSKTIIATQCEHLSIHIVFILGEFNFYLKSTHFLHIAGSESCTDLPACTYTL